MSGSYCDPSRVNAEAQPRRINIAAWAAVSVTFISLTGGSIFAFGQLFNRVDQLEDRLMEHGVVAAHGTVSERLKEHDTKLEGQARSLQTVNRANERLSNDLYQLKTDLRVLEQQVESLHRYEVDP